jgi:hypothetical protein
MNAPALPCRLCGADTAPCGRQPLIGHDVGIHRCPRCDLLQTDTPHWLEEAYAEALSSLDTGAIQRNQIAANVTLAAARAIGLDPTARCLDWGGGHGVFVRMMRDRGLDFRWTDRYAQNLYARGFDGDPAAQYDLVTAFEVLEHLVDVAGELEAMFRARPAFLLVATRLHHGYDREWWYFARETGQHVAFYSANTMRFIAERFGYRVSVGEAFSLFARADRPLGRVRRALLAQIVARPFLTYALSSLVPDPIRFKLGHYPSLTQRDHAALRDAVGGEQAVPPPPRRDDSSP